MPRLSADVFTHAFTYSFKGSFKQKQPSTFKFIGAKYNFYNNSVTLTINLWQSSGKP